MPFLRVNTNTGPCAASRRVGRRVPPRANVYAHGVTKVQGMRPHQQDRHHVFHATDESGAHVCSFYCVFDGHGGHRASDYCVEHLCNNVMGGIETVACGSNGPGISAVSEGLRMGFVKTDRDFLAAEEARQHGANEGQQRPCGKGQATSRASLDGTTAVVLLVWPALRRIFVAHVGDSRVVLVTAEKRETRAAAAVPVPTAYSPHGVTHDSALLHHQRASRKQTAATFKVTQVTREHKPTGHSEAVRIRKAGGVVKDGRVQGILAMSRAIGNATLKPLVSPEPDIVGLPVPEITKAMAGHQHPCHLAYSLAIIGTDGLWDVVSNGQAAAIVVAAVERGLTLECAVQQLICAAGGKACEDNATAMIVCIDANT